MNLDSIDYRILATLQADGRITNNSLAEKVGLSPSACLRRVQLLEKAGVIEGYMALVDAAQLGRPTTVVVQITLERQTDDHLEAFEAAIAHHAEVVECYLMSGMADYLLRVAVRDAEDYERLHRAVLARLPGVARIQSSFAIRTVICRPSIPVGELGGPAETARRSPSSG
jgi:DNA-binding Lrp family transcriptional regulator